MPTWEERFTRREPPDPPLELIDVCWRVIGPSHRPLACGLYRITTGIEVRVGYSADDILRTQLCPDIDTARQIAAAWREAALAKGFQEMPPA